MIDFFVAIWDKLVGFFVRDQYYKERKEFDKEWEEYQKYSELARNKESNEAILKKLSSKELETVFIIQQAEKAEDEIRRKENEHHKLLVETGIYDNRYAIAYESFLKRASSFEHPFVLKGGFALKHYFADEIMRYSEDIDWVYTEPLNSQSHARMIFTEWLDKIVETNIDGDRIRFEKSSYGVFWESLDYANENDFPTTSTEIRATIDNIDSLDITVQISFNLELTYPPVTFLYKPCYGNPFIVPKAVSLPVQIAWKLHQTLCYSRFKDVFDLIHLLKHPDFEELAMLRTMQELVNECAVGGEDIHNLRWFIGDMATRFFYLKENNLMETEEFKNLDKMSQHDKVYLRHLKLYDYSTISHNADKWPQSLEQVFTDFKEALNNAGFTENVFSLLPLPNRKKLFFKNPEDFRASRSRS